MPKKGKKQTKDIPDTMDAKGNTASNEKSIQPKNFDYAFWTGEGAGHAVLVGDGSNPRQRAVRRQRPYGVPIQFKLKNFAEEDYPELMKRRAENKKAFDRAKYYFKAKPNAKGEYEPKKSNELFEKIAKDLRGKDAVEDETLFYKSLVENSDDKFGDGSEFRMLKLKKKYNKYIRSKAILEELNKDRPAVAKGNRAMEVADQKLQIAKAKEFEFGEYQNKMDNTGQK